MFSTFKSLILQYLTRWRWIQSGANCSPEQIACKQGNLQGKSQNLAKAPKVKATYYAESRPVSATRTHFSCQIKQGISTSDQGVAVSGSGALNDGENCLLSLCPP